MSHSDQSDDSITFVTIMINSYLHFYLTHDEQGFLETKKDQVSAKGLCVRNNEPIRFMLEYLLTEVAIK